MKKYNYLALGDSYTIGEGVDRMMCFPYGIVNASRKKGFDIEEFSIIATTGWTTTDLLSDLKESDIYHIKWDVVTLLIGVNNQYQNMPVGIYKKEYVQLLDICMELVHHIPQKIIGISIPDYGVTPFAVNLDKGRIKNELTAYNKIASTILQTQGSPYVDIVDISLKSEQDGSLITNDGLHPSGIQYRYWVKRILPTFINTLENG